MNENPHLRPSPRTTARRLTAGAAALGLAATGGYVVLAARSTDPAAASTSTGSTSTTTTDTGSTSRGTTSDGTQPAQPGLSSGSAGSSQGSSAGS